MVENVIQLPAKQHIRDILATGEQDQRKRFLKGIVAEMARQRRLEDTEILCELHLELESMVLWDILNARQIIEREQNVSIDKSHLTVWSALMNALLPNEFSTLYHAMDHHLFPHGEIIVKQGSLHPALYFVNSGRVELFFQKNGTDLPVKVAGPGEILGANTFFESSVWTINARSLGAEVSSVALGGLERSLTDFPGLESKLNDFCIRFDSSYEPFEGVSRDRRMHKRVRISGGVKLILFDREGKNTGFGAKADLFNISAGGVSFYLHISSKKIARLLLGRNVGLLTMTSPSASRFSMTGMVLAVRSQTAVGNEYSMSVRFSNVLTQKELNDLITSGY